MSWKDPPPEPEHYCGTRQSSEHASSAFVHESPTFVRKRLVDLQEKIDSASCLDWASVTQAQASEVQEVLDELHQISVVASAKQPVPTSSPRGGSGKVVLQLVQTCTLTSPPEPSMPTHACFWGPTTGHGTPESEQPQNAHTLESPQPQARLMSVLAAP